MVSMQDERCDECGSTRCTCMADPGSRYYKKRMAELDRERKQEQGVIAILRRGYEKELENKDEEIRNLERTIEMLEKRMGV